MLATMQLNLMGEGLCTAPLGTRTARDLTVSQGTILWSRSIMLTRAVLMMTVSLA